MKNLSSIIILFVGLFMVSFFYSCSKEGELTFSNDENEFSSKLLDKRVKEIKDFIHFYKNYRIRQTEWRSEYYIGASNLDAFIHLSEDALNYWHGYNIMEFTESDYFYLNVDISAYGDTITTAQSIALFSTILDTICRGFYGLNNNQAVFSFVEIEKVAPATLQLDVHYGISQNFNAQVLQFRTFNPSAKDYFPEGVNYELHRGEDDEDFCSRNCDNWNQCVYTSYLIGVKAFNNYWFDNTLQAGGTWIDIHTQPNSSNTVPGWWQGPRFTTIPCADYNELNGYVDVTTDLLVAEENRLNKKCFYFRMHDGIFTWPSQKSKVCVDEFGALR